MFQYFQGLSPGGDFVVTAVVYMFQYFQNSHLGVLLYLLLFTCSNITRNSHLGMLLYLLLLTCSVIYWNSHLAVVLLYLMLFTGSVISRNSHRGWCFCICCCLHVPLSPGTPTFGYCCCICCCSRSNISRDLPGGNVVVSAIVHMFQYFQGLLPGVMLLYLLLFTCSNISRNSHLEVLLYLLLFTCSTIFQELLPRGDVVVSAVVYRFQYFQELSPLSAVVLILGGENFLHSPVFLSKNNKTLHIEIAGKKVFLNALYQPYNVCTLFGLYFIYR
jgi:hypothetical protein